MIQPTGPIPARIMIVGDFPGMHEERLGVPIAGASATELDKMLHEAGILRNECFVTNVCRVRPMGDRLESFVAAKKKDITSMHLLIGDKYVLPPVKQGIDMLKKEIEIVRPNVILVLGNLALWALTGCWGVARWRGSLLQIGGGPKVIPSLHPSTVIREWAMRHIVVQDFRRVAANRTSAPYALPKWDFIIRPSFLKVIGTLTGLQNLLNEGTSFWIDFDLETKHNHIDCAGISWSLTEAICIPFFSKNNKEGYWNLEEEYTIVYLLFLILTHPLAKIRGQNLLYDAQYTQRHWFFTPNVKQDTMIEHHTCFAGLKKSLDFQASIYCRHYIQWKPDKSSWKAGG